MNKTHIIRIILIILILLWMNIVFGFSNQNGEKSSGVSMKISMFLTNNNEEVSKILEPYIRKIAHFSEYSVGGGLIYLLLLTFEQIKEKYKIIFSTIIGLIYAITDELHQLFIGGRTAKIQDVYIDTLGVIFGILLILLIRKIVDIKFTRKEG